MAQFSLRPVDAKNFSFFRGHTILRTLLTQRPANGSTIVSHVLAAPGHFAVVVHGWTTCILFDAVPSAHQANSTMQEQVLQAINAKKAVPADCHIFCSTHSPPIAMVSIIDKRLFILQRDGVLYWHVLSIFRLQSDPCCNCWRWSADEYLWRLFGRAAPQSSPPPSIVTAVLHPRLRRLVCIEMSDRKDRGWRISQTPLSFDEQCSDSLKAILLDRTETVAFERDPLSRLYLAPDGVWVMSGETRELPSQLLDLRTLQLHPVLLPTSGAAEFIQCAPYVPTGELILLDAQGRVFVCRPEAQRHEPSVSLCASLLDFARDDVQVLAAHNGAALVFRSRSVSIFDLSSGALLRQEMLPTRVEGTRGGPWSCVAGAEIGVWGEGGMWCIQWASVMSHAAAVARLPSPLEHGLSPAASVCNAWDIKPRAGAYLLEQALAAGSNDELKKHACAALLSTAQNPALLVGLLSGRHNQYLLKHVRDFTTRAACRPAAQTVEARRVAAHDTFAYWTPLNNSLLPLLQQYQTLVEREAEVPRAAASLSVDLSAGELEIAALDEPAPLLQSLESRFKLNKAAVLTREAPVDDALLAEESKDGVAYFELMCVLYHACDPDLLPYFVALVDAEAKRRTPLPAAAPPVASLSVPAHASASPSPPPSPSPSEDLTPTSPFFERAINALPLLSEWSRPSSAQVLARAKLLFGAGFAQEGVDLLLNYDLWEAAVAAVKQRTTQDALHCDLFHSLLDAALRRRATERFAELWDLKPLNYAALDLFEAVLEAMPPSPSINAADILATGEGSVPLSAFFPRLSDLVNAPPF